MCGYDLWITTNFLIASTREGREPPARRTLRETLCEVATELSLRLL